MSLAYGDTKDSLNNRKNFLKALSIDYGNLVCAEQVHGATIHYVRETDRGRGALSADTAIPSTDALITDKKNLPLAVFTADCLSVFLYDPRKNAIGVVHAGWRSSREEIALKTVRLMQEKFQAEPEDILAGFGPAIRECCYHLDLVGSNKKQLLSSGVKETNISDCGICTVCKNSEYFSYRKEKDAAGRMISLILLKDA